MAPTHDDPNRKRSAAEPLVSIGLPVYNGEAFLEQSIRSILDQTYRSIELIISDNASTDGTAEIIERCAAEDDRIRAYRCDHNRGAGWNFNHVLELAQGKYFKWQAHDDLIEPSFLQEAVDALEADPGVSLVHSLVDVIDEDSRHVEDYGIRLRTEHASPAVRFAELVLKWQMCYEIFGLIRMEHLVQTAGMGNFSHGDGILLADLGLRGRFHLVDKVRFHSRRHSGQSMRQFGQEGGGNDYHGYAVWFDPSRAGRLLLPNWEIVWNYQRVVLRTPMSFTDRLRCQWVVLRRARADARHLLADLALSAKRPNRVRRTIRVVSRRFEDRQR